MAAKDLSLPVTKKGKKGKKTAPQEQNPDGVPLADTEPVKCACGFGQFMVNYMMRRVSPILTGEPLPRYMPIQVMNCLQCGKILYEALDPQLQALLLMEIKAERQEAQDAGETETPE